MDPIEYVILYFGGLILSILYLINFWMFEIILGIDLESLSLLHLIFFWWAFVYGIFIIKDICQLFFKRRRRVSLKETSNVN